MAERKGLRPVKKKTAAELKIELKEYRRKKLKRNLLIIGVIAVALVLIGLFTAVRSFDSFTVSSSQTRGDSSASGFAEFNGKILEYSNDGISCSNKDGTRIWNQSFEMNSPSLDICGAYAVIYDRGGTEVCILNEEGITETINTQYLVVKVSIASQGTIAVMSKEDDDIYIDLYDKNGGKLTSGEYHAEQNIIPIDIALSDDAQNMAVDSLNMNSKTMNAQIDFYNFGTAGQGKENNLVAEYTYEEMVIPEIDYISENRMIAIADGQAIVYKGTEEPKESSRITFDAEVSCVFHNDKYIGIAYPNEGDDVSFHLKVYDLKGKTVMENETSILFNQISLLSNNEICVLGNYDVDLYTIHSIKKFTYEFDSELYAFFQADGIDSYLVMRKGQTERIKLKN